MIVSLIFFGALAIVGLLCVVRASALARKIVGVVNESYEAEGKQSPKVRHFLDFLHVSDKYVEITGDRKSGRLIYVLTFVGSALFVVSSLSIAIDVMSPGQR